MSDGYDDGYDDNSYDYHRAPAKTPYVSDGSAWGNTRQNFNKTVGDFSQGNILHGLADAYNFRYDPTGNWSGQQSQQQQQQQYKPFTPEPTHLQSPDENGIMKFNDDGQKAFQQHLAAAEQGTPPPMQPILGQSQSNADSTPAPLHRGLIGRVFHHIIGDASADALQQTTKYSSSGADSNGDSPDVEGM